MIRTLVAALTLLAATPAAAQAPAFTSLTRQFDAFALGSANLPRAQRVAAFRSRFAPLLPGFYAPRDGVTEDELNTRIASALDEYPQRRERFLAAAEAFAETYATATARFRRFFPDYAPTMAIYLVHSLGEMDGGTRTVRGRLVAIFGADVIAQIHDRATIGPFLDHELFHFYHARYFPECEALWCGLWREGLAVYVASRMNPGSDDHALALTLPRPIRPEVQPRLAEAMCFTRTSFDSEDPAVSHLFFRGGGQEGAFPPRFGYFVGYVLAQRLGEGMPLEQLAKLGPAQVRARLLAELSHYHCA